jgi:hypothetical protein
MTIDLTPTQRAVLTAALELCENAAPLPDGNAQILEEFSEALGNALVVLADEERDQYQDFFALGQQGLSSSQVALQRAFMPDPQVKIEQAIDAADKLYLAVFDEVIVPGRIYQINPSSNGVRYLSQDSVKAFLEKHGAVA